jgi:alkylated DNA nucleotide flippase Atl1
MTQQIRIPAKTREVFEYLKECAEQMRTITYGEIANEVGLAKPGVGRPLGYIRDEICRRRGLPWLNAIAVNLRTSRPGDGFIPEDITLHSDDEEILWRGIVLQVFAYDWLPLCLKTECKFREVNFCGFR